MRPLRLNAPGLLYHVMSRGVAGRRIFLDDKDYEHFLRVVDVMVERFCIECHAFCEMPNHYHLALRTTDANLSRAIQHLNGTYAQWWNWRHEKVGHVFQARFKAQVVESGRYFSNLVRYIARNPLRAGLVDDVGHWPWSSFRATAGRERVPRFLTVDRVLGMYGARNRALQTACFREHVCMDDPDESRIAELVRADARVLGSEMFSLRFADAARGASPEVPHRDRRCGEPGLATLLRSRICAVPLPQLMLEAHERHGFRQRDIAVALGLSNKAVAAMIRVARTRRVADLAPVRSGNQT